MPKSLNLDPISYAKRLSWQRMRAQALFRGEPYTLTLDEFCTLWTDELWAQRGMALDQLVMSRKDRQAPWSKSNCCIITRQKQFDITGGETKGIKRGPQKNPRKSKINTLLSQGGQ